MEQEKSLDVNGMPPPHQVKRKSGSQPAEDSRAAGRDTWRRPANLQKQKSLKGETILEVVISISVLMIAMTPASGMIVDSIRNTALNRDTAIASPLADSGLEILRGMLAGNLLKFSAKKTECWNTKQGYANIDDCQDIANKIGDAANFLAGDAGEQHFRLTLNPDTYRWDLETSTADLEAAPGSQGDIENYRLKKDSDPHPSVYFLAPNGFDTAGRGTDTPFFSQINIKYADFNNDSVADAMKITSIVLFASGAKPQIIKRSTVFFKP